MSFVTNLYVGLRTNSQGFARDMRAAESPVVHFENVARRASERMASIGFDKLKMLGAVLAGVFVGKGVAESFQGVIDRADELTKAAPQIGAMTNELERLTLVADQSGVSGEEITKGWVKLNRTMAEAADGAKRPLAAFRRLNLDVEKLSAMRPERQLAAIADAFRLIQTPADRVKVAMDLFGKGGASMIPMLDQSQEALDRLSGYLDWTNVALTDVDWQNIDNMGDAMTRLKWIATGFARTVMAEVAPALLLLVQGFMDDTTESTNMSNRVRDLTIQLAYVADTLNKLWLLLTVPFRAFNSIVEGLLAAFHGIELAVWGVVRTFYAGFYSIQRRIEQYWSKAPDAAYEAGLAQINAYFDGLMSRTNEDIRTYLGMVEEDWRNIGKGLGYENLFGDATPLAERTVKYLDSLQSARNEERRLLEVRDRQNDSLTTMDRNLKKVQKQAVDTRRALDMRQEAQLINLGRHGLHGPNAALAAMAITGRLDGGAAAQTGAQRRVPGVVPAGPYAPNGEPLSRYYGRDQRDFRTQERMLEALEAIKRNTANNYAGGLA